jgi:molecular chaperone IbpA
MTNLSLRSLDIPSIHKFAVGFDNMFDELLRNTTQQASSNYPPYNVIKHSEDKFTIELAVAGFKEGDISVQIEKNQLTVSGDQATELNSEREYLHRGISARNFTRVWTLADNVEVKGAEVANGILTINLERYIPEEQKPKKIAITYNK